MSAESDRIAAADRNRTALQFLSFLNGATGSEQSYAGADNMAVNYPGQYQTISPYGVSTEGQAVSNKQSTVRISSGVLLLLAAGVAFVVLTK